MAIIYTQTDTNGSACNTLSELIACSGLSGGTTLSKQATVGGTAGVTEWSDTINASSTLIEVFGIEITPDSGVSWDAGTWTVRWNVTTSNMSCTVVAVYVCRVNSSCVNQETIGSATGLSISQGSTGVKSQTVSGSAVTPSAGDKVLVVMAVQNTAMTNQTLGWTPDQNIDSPFTAAPAQPTLSGVSATGAVGALAASVVVALTGVLATGSVGTLSPSTGFSAALTGNTATASAGSVAPVISAPLSGNVGTGAVGSLAAAVQTALSGNSATGAVGTLSPSSSYSATISGNQATGSVGSLAASVSLALSGNSGTGSVGTLTPAAAGSVALTGVSATGSVGTFGVSVSLSLPGNSATGGVGSLSPSSGSVPVTPDTGSGGGYYRYFSADEMVSCKREIRALEKKEKEVERRVRKVEERIDDKRDEIAYAQNMATLNGLIAELTALQEKLEELRRKLDQIEDEEMMLVAFICSEYEQRLN